VSDREAAEPETLSPSEALDEDDLRVDPLEAGVEPPEHSSAVDRYGTTPREVREGEPLGERLKQEEPDTEADPVPERPVAATPVTELDGSIEDAPADVERVAPEDDVPARRHSDPDPGDQVDFTSSVADAIRQARSD